MSSGVPRVSRVRRTRYTPYSPQRIPPQQVLPRVSPQWSHKFFCLANVGTLTVPVSKGVRDALTSVGLGEKVLSIPISASAADFH